MTFTAVTRRKVIAGMLAGSAAVGLPLAPLRAHVLSGKPFVLSDGVLTLSIDPSLETSLAFGGKTIAAPCPQDIVRVAGSDRPVSFLVLDHTVDKVPSVHGPATRHSLRGVAGRSLELRKTVIFADSHPGVAIVETSLHNVSGEPLAIDSWTYANHTLPTEDRGPAWTFAGASYADRRDWIQPVTPDFDQRNFMGMNASDYGGGTPVAVVWNRDCGIAVGHLEATPRLASLPVVSVAEGTELALREDDCGTLMPGESIASPAHFVMPHRGDFFAPLDRYRRLMADRGVTAPRPPAASYEPIWCAWGYERDYTTEQVVGTLSKAREIGLRWAVLDDGWQKAIGDWEPDARKYPAGDADMRAFVDEIEENEMLARLWIAPLAAKPDAEILRDHSDWLLLDEQGKPQDISWWDSFTLCPAHPPVVDHFRALVRKAITEWGYAGFKLDGQHLNGVAPCHNPAHGHASPEESFDKLQDFWLALYDEAMAANPNAVVEICPCGDSFAFHNLPATNNIPASDPLSSWQIRLKGKTLKALMGPDAPYSGDHVELSDGGRDFASTYGIGAIPSTKFTWPKDTDRPIGELPEGGYVLTAEKEAHWRKWIALYRERRLAEGEYLGELYDLGFDRPEAHVIRKEGEFHYAFYADKWDGPIELRGLPPGHSRVVDAVTGHKIAAVTADNHRIYHPFEGHLLLRVVPLEIAL